MEYKLRSLSERLAWRMRGNRLAIAARALKSENSSLVDFRPERTINNPFIVTNNEGLANIVLTVNLTDFRYSGRLSGDGSNAPDTRIAFTIAARESRSPQLTFELSISGTSKHDAFRRIALDHTLDQAYIDLIQKLIARLEIPVEEEEFNYE